MYHKYRIALQITFVVTCTAICSLHFTARPRTPLGRAWSLLDPLLTTIRDAVSGIERIVATGSFRRFAAVTGNLEVMARAMPVLLLNVDRAGSRVQHYRNNCMRRPWWPG